MSPRRGRKGKSERKNSAKASVPSPSSSVPKQSGFSFYDLIMIIIASIGVLVNVIFNPKTQEKISPPPLFSVEMQKVRWDGSIRITAANRTAKVDGPLDFRLNGMLFSAAAKPIPTEKGVWVVSLSETIRDESLKVDGFHTVEVAPPGEKASSQFKVCISSQEPSVDVSMGDMPDGSGKFIEGTAYSPFLIDGELLQVSIAIRNDHSWQEIPLALQRVRTQDGDYFEFSVPIYGSGGGRVQNQPFFRFEVRDFADNQVFFEETFEQFMKPGFRRFSFGPQKELAMDWQSPSEVPSAQRSILANPVDYNLEAARFRLYVSNQESRTPELRWDGNAMPSLVFKNGKQKAVILGNTYRDPDFDPAVGSEYRVVQFDKDGKPMVSSSWHYDSDRYREARSITLLACLPDSIDDVWQRRAATFMEGLNREIVRSVHVNGFPELSIKTDADVQLEENQPFNPSDFYHQWNSLGASYAEWLAEQNNTSVLFFIGHKSGHDLVVYVYSYKNDSYHVDYLEPDEDISRQVQRLAGVVLGSF